MPSGKEMPKKNKVRCKAVTWILECSRFILLKKEMPYPGKSVAHEGDNYQKNPVEGEEKSDETDNHQARPYKM